MAPSRSLLVAAYLILACACGGGGGGDGTTAPPPPPPPSASFAGFVGDDETDGLPVAGAQVTVAGLSATATTDKDGRFVWPSSIPAGSHRVTIVAAGYDALAKDITLQPGNNSSNFPLLPVLTFFASGNTLVYLPPGVSTIRGAFFVLYGGTSDSRPLLRGELDFYQNAPPSGDVAGYRTALRKFARERGFAIVGMKTPLVNASGATVASNLLQGLRDASIDSKHPELADAALLMQGMSTGACFVNKVVAEIPSRVIGFISMKSGAGCSFAAGSAADAVPGYFFIGALDTPEINVPVTNDFQSNRARGAFWAFAVERDVGHVWVGNHALIFNWAGAVAAQRLPATMPPGAPVALRQVGETSGWLGDRTSLSIAAYPCFPGNKLAASWLPSEQTARDWQSMMGSVTTVLGCN